MNIIKTTTFVAAWLLVGALAIPSAAFAAKYCVKFPHEENAPATTVKFTYSWQLEQFETSSVVDRGSGSTPRDGAVAEHQIAGASALPGAPQAMNGKPVCIDMVKLRREVDVSRNKIGYMKLAPVGATIQSGNATVNCPPTASYVDAYRYQHRTLTVRGQGDSRTLHCVKGRNKKK